MISANPTADTGRQQHQTATRISGQGALLMSGFALSQAFSFARNALIGHWLSQGDFGIAATITLMLQLIDVLSDVGADRLLVQSPDGENERLLGTCHLVLICRGVLTSLVLYLAAGPVTALFAIPDARWAFEAAALAPLIKGFLHLDIRRFQRHLNNRAFIATEVIPQAAAFALMPVALILTPGYDAIVWICLLQATCAVGVSHLLAERRYRIFADASFLKRLIAFGWPIWLSAFPLAAVYQGDRILVGSLLGVEALAAFTAAFMITMVPGLVAGRVGNALMLPLLASVKDDAVTFSRRYALMVEAMLIVAVGYLAFFIIAGGSVLPIAFGPNYVGLSALVAWLAVMWSMRMLQAVPGMALMADGDTRPLLIAGLIRATGLGLALLAARYGYGLVGMAAAGAFSELCSLLYVAVRAARDRKPLATILLSRSMLLLPVGGLAFAVTFVTNSASLMIIGLAGIAAAISVMAASAAILPSARALLVDFVRDRFAVRGELPAAPHHG